MTAYDQYNILRDYKDEELELLWISLGDAPFDFEREIDGILDVDWYVFPKGTDKNTIWYFFDSHHSKGVACLMNELEDSDKAIPKRFGFIPNPPITQNELTKILSEIENWEYELSIERERKIKEKQDTSGFKEINIKKNAWIKIPSKEIFNVWIKYKGDCFIEVICP